MYTEYMERFLAGEPLAAARLMSLVERGGAEAEAILTELFPRTGGAYRIGVTGLTGAGKSTLVNHLIQRYRARGATIGVVAEDPTSPFSGGAILGDRVRMQGAAGDEGVFIRSIASRGSDTGLSACANELADVLDAFGQDVIFLETIGVGQLEHRIRFSAQTTIVVLTPDAGDDVQSLKSGLMEVGDLFVVNKADRAPAARFAEDLRSMLELRLGNREWVPAVVSTVAVDGGGVDELVAAIESHREFLSSDGRVEQKRETSLRQRVAVIVEEKLREFFLGNPYIESKLDGVLKQVLSGKKSPHEAAEEIVGELTIKKRKGDSE